MKNQSKVHLSRDGNNQILRIPSEFQFPTNEVILHKENDYLIIEPVVKPSLLAVLETLPQLEEDFPDVDERLSPLEEIEL
ncbi:MAG: AbrB/MazE/SpoVT family DNA-binding domain-containing protein [Halothece sp. Uz-M2-17]|nr:AbrB/MazE/SpoVT family DNA-binding domain-containing protein [Halothece sp. Uz-M2-17]